MLNPSCYDRINSLMAVACALAVLLCRHTAADFQSRNWWTDGPGSECGRQGWHSARLRRNPAPEGSRRASPFLRSREGDFSSTDTNVDNAGSRKLGIDGC